MAADGDELSYFCDASLYKTLFYYYAVATVQNLQNTFIEKITYLFVC